VKEDELLVTGYWILVTGYWLLVTDDDVCVAPAIRRPRESGDKAIIAGLNETRMNAVIARLSETMFSNVAERYTMSGEFFTEYLPLLKRSPEEVVESLRTDLLSDDVDRAKIAAALVRVRMDIRDQYNRAGMGVITMVNGDVCEVDPDSPMFPDVTPLIPLVLERFPLPHGQEAPGMMEASSHLRRCEPLVRSASITMDQSSS
jgi:hypothetical protein